jgi:hypothetical protein
MAKLFGGEPRDAVFIDISIKHKKIYWKTACPARHIVLVEPFDRSTLTRVKTDKASSDPRVESSGHQVVPACAPLICRAVRTIQEDFNEYNGSGTQRVFDR